MTDTCRCGHGAPWHHASVIEGMRAGCSVRGCPCPRYQPVEDPT